MKMDKSINLIAHAVSLLLASYSLTAIAAEPTTLDAKIKKTTLSNSGCVIASKKCLLEVTPITSSHGDRLFNINQECDQRDTRLKYLYKMPMSEQLAQRTFLGNSFCFGTVSISDMNLPFGKELGVEDANDGLLLIDTAEEGIHDIQGLLGQMQQLASEAASGKYTPSQLTNLNLEFDTLLSEVNRIAYTTSFGSYNVLAYPEKILNVPINKGRNQITVKLANMTTGTEGLSISTLEIDTVDHAKEAVKKLPHAVMLTKTGMFNLDLSKPALKLAAAHDATITTVNLNEDVFVVKRSGLS